MWAKKFWVVLSFLLAIMVMLLPLPREVGYFRPDFVLLVMLYWIIAFPSRHSVLGMWCLGLLMDLVTGTTFGLHALIYVFVGYLMVKLRTRFLMYAIVQQTACMAFFVAINVLMQQWLMDIIYNQGQSGTLWWSVLLTALLWPILFLMLESYKDHFHIVVRRIY